MKSYIMSLMGFYPSEQEVGEVIYHVINGVLPLRTGGRSSHISCH